MEEKITKFIVSPVGQLIFGFAAFGWSIANVFTDQIGATFINWIFLLISAIVLGFTLKEFTASNAKRKVVVIFYAIAAIAVVIGLYFVNKSKQNTVIELSQCANDSCSVLARFVKLEDCEKYKDLISQMNDKIFIFTCK